MRRWHHRILAVVVGGVAVLGVPATAGALSDVTEPADAAIGPTEATVDATARRTGDALAPVTDPVTDAVSPVRDAVDATTAGARDAVGGATGPLPDDTVQSTIDDVLADDGADTGGATVRPDPLTTTTTTRVPDTVGGRAAARTSTSQARRAASSGAAATAGRQRQRLAPTPLVVAPATAAAERQSALRAGLEAARPFAFPLAVAAAVLVFLALQRHLDSRDPKLADTGDEELSFA